LRDHRFFDMHPQSFFKEKRTSALVFGLENTVERKLYLEDPSCGKYVLYVRNDERGALLLEESEGWDVSEDRRPSVYWRQAE